jgi:hypothetical protein
MLEHDEHEVEWPAPRQEPETERSHRAARIADYERGVELGDVDDDDERADDA